MSKISPVNVFTPSSEINDTLRFAGRAKELQTLATALESDGAQIVLYGNRGVGKSSLARQLEKMASSDSEVIKRLTRPPAKDFDYLTIYFRCDDTVDSIQQLLLRMLTDDSALAYWVPFRILEKSGTKTLGGKLSVKFFEINGASGEAVKEAPQELEADVTSIFINTLKRINDSKLSEDGVLLIIDEYDRIKDRTGLASLLKTLGPKKVKFALVGVGTTVQELIIDHASVDRQLTDGTVLVPPMSDDEIYEIFDKAETLLDDVYIFDQEAQDWIITVAKGHPFYVHLIAKHSLLHAIENGRTKITKDDAETAMSEIALKGSAPIQEAAYKTAIGHSYIRESVLREFATVNEDEIHTGALYSRLAKRLSVDPSTISVYVGQLSVEKYGPVLEKTRERYYRFKDSLFKAYAAARPWQWRQGDQEEE